MKKLLILLWLIALLPAVSFSQTIKIDSVLNSIQAEPDTIRIEKLINIYRDLENVDIQYGKKFLDQALLLSKDVNDKKWYGRVLLQLGNYNNISGEYAKAIDYFKKSLEVYELISDYSSIGSSYNNLGATYEKMGRYDEAMDNLLKALSIYESNQDSSNMAKSYLNLGLLYFRHEEFDKSMKLYKKSLEIRKQINDEEGIALVYNNMAIVNYYTGNYDNVRNYFEMAYETYVKVGNLRRQVMALSNLAEILNIIGQKGKALERYIQVLELEKKLGQKGEVAKTYILIGDLYKSREDYKNAISYLNEGVKIAKEIGSLPEVESAYSLLAKIYAEQKSFEQAFTYHELYFEVHDSIFNAEKSKQIKELETKYETRKKEQQIKDLENQKTIQDLRIKKQQIFIFSIFAGLISISVFLIILFRQIKTIRNANSLLAYQKKQIMDSIEYASRIQTAILPPKDLLDQILPEHFIFYKPRDVVSGDFYWITHKDGKIVVAAVDCTGHGVPGAFMSMLGFAFLNEIVNKEVDLKANEILNQLREYVKSSLRQTGKADEAKDGMDIALCIIDTANFKLQYAGAYNPLYLIRNEEFISVKADRMPIGIHILEKESFTNHEIEIQKGDILYIFTDGYIDQFGGSDSRKYKLTPFKELLISIKSKPLIEQKRILEDEFLNWKGPLEQIDDILVIGIKI